jgi:hypothetical protein
VPGAIPEAELMQVSSLPLEGPLENPMQLVQSQIGSQFELPQIGGSVYARTAETRRVRRGSRLAVVARD